MVTWPGQHKQLQLMQQNHLREGRYRYIVMPFYFDRVRRKFSLEKGMPIGVKIYI